MQDHETSDDASWFERPGNINRLIGGLVIACVASVVAQFFYEPHGHFDLEDSFAFQAWFGFVAFVVVVFLGCGLRLIVGRKEDYYDDVR